MELCSGTLKRRGAPKPNPTTPITLPSAITGRKAKAWCEAMLRPAASSG